MSLFDLQNVGRHREAKIFLDGGAGIQRFDVVKYPSIEESNQRVLGMYWRPEEVDLTKDRIDFEKNMNDVERFIADANIKRQIVLDTVQGRAPSAIFGPICSLPEVENFVQAWSFYEGNIHSRSYTHILSNAYPDAEAVFNGVTEVREIVKMGKNVALYYDALDWHNHLYAVHKKHPEIGEQFHELRYNQREHKKAIWRALVVSYALEGQRFFLSFAAAFRQAVNKKMVGNATIMRLICRDEQDHLYFVKLILLALPKEDKEFAEIAEELKDWTIQTFVDVNEEEKAWGKYMFQHGELDGFGAIQADAYLDWLASQRLKDIGLEYPGNAPSKNPIPWIDFYVNFGKTQKALQETENDSYVVGLLDTSGDNSNLDGIQLSLDDVFTRRK